MPGKVLRSLFDRHAPVHLNARLNWSTLKWMRQWRRACTPERHLANRSSMQRLGLYSKTRLDDIVRRLRLDYERSSGVLILLRGEADLAQAQAGLALLRDLGIKHITLDAAACRTIEPGLNPDTALHAGIALPEDEVGNCRQFTHLLRSEAQSLGVRFRFRANVQRIVPGRRPELVLQPSSIDDVETHSTLLDPSRAGFAPTVPMPVEPTPESVDAVVVCAANDSRALLAPHGLRIPLMPVYGYSVTAPIRQHDHERDRGPVSAVMDEHYKVAVSRIGSRLRVAGCAELGGDPLRHNARALDTLYKVLNDWYPGAARLSHAQRWKGARPMLPDGPPIVGACSLPGVWLNLGHGSSGWALACGCAKVVADMLARRTPEVDTQGLGIERLLR